MFASILIDPVDSTRDAAVRYDESTKGSLWFIVKGVTLTLLTVGIYRFWFKTAVRKNLWARAFVLGSPAEYTGKAHELLLGFLVALAIMLPVYIVVFIAAMYSPYPTLSYLFAYLQFFLLLQFARYRAWRYLVSRTVWRGIRLQQDGSALHYTLLAAGWWLVTLATLGVAYPFMRASLERYRMNHTLVGETRFTSDAEGRCLLFNWMVVYVLCILPILECIFILLAASNFYVPTEFPEGETLRMIIYKLILSYRTLVPPECFTGVAKTIFGAVVLGVILGSCYRTRETKVFLDRINLNGARLRSKISTLTMFINYLRFYASLLALAFIIALVGFISSFVLSKFTHRIDPYQEGIWTAYSVVAVCFFAYFWLNSASFRSVD